MKVDCLIIGQGIAGTLLSYRLLLAGKSVVVIDDGSGGKASRVAGAVINPRSGKNNKPSPGADYLVPAATTCYQALETLLEKPLLQQLPLYTFAEQPAAQQDLPVDLEACFRVSVSALDSVWVVDALSLLNTWKGYLQQQNAFLQETFSAGHLQIGTTGIQYKHITAGHIVFCEGAVGRSNDLFAALPFTANRGEALLLDIPGLPADAVYHYNLRLVPRQDGLFWCGSNYRWQFENLEPDTAWRTHAEEELESWLQKPFTIVDHIVAERPTTAGQIPFVGLHPVHPRVGILNGLGTRGFSAGPFWAAELARKIENPDHTIRHYQESWLHRKLMR